MADRKISDLSALTTPASGDYVPIVDISETGASSKNKRITIEELMRGMPDGTAAAPGIAFETDPNTGIYSPGADQLAVATNGTGRLFVDANGSIRIAWDCPRIIANFDNDFRQGLQFNDGNRTLNLFSTTTDSGGAITFSTRGTSGSSDTDYGTERARIDSSGRLLVGTSSARTSASHTGSLQLEGTTFNASTFSIIADANDASGSYIHLGKARGGSAGSTTIVADGDTLGQIHFTGADGTNLLNSSFISAQVDGTPGANNMPGRLVFSTTASGGSPTERLRITAAGNVGIGTTSPSSLLHLADAGHITVGTTTGTKIGTATTQKIGFFDKAPVVQPTAVADATDAATVITQLNALLTRMRNLGLIAT